MNATATARVIIVGTDTTGRKLADLLAATDPRTASDVDAVIGLCAPRDAAPLDDALDRLATFDWLMLLSPPACRFLVERAQQLDVSLAHLRVAVVGDATAQAASEAGLQTTVIAPGATLASLVHALCSRDDTRGANILVPRSAVADDDALAPLVDHVAPAGSVCSVVAYDNTPLPVDATRWAARLAAADAMPSPIIVFLSASSVTALWSGLPVDLRPALAARARTVAMGPSTAAALAQVRWPATLTADPPGLARVVSCVQSLRV